MNSSVVFEALALGCKEGVKIGAVWLILKACFEFRKKPGLLKPFYAGLISAFILSIVFFFSLRIPKEYISNFISTTFGFLLLASLAALLNSSGVRLFPFRTFNFERFSFLLIFPAAVVFFVPDITGTLLYFRELAELNERAAATFLSGAAGLLIVLSGFAVLISRIRGGLLGSLFDVPQVLLSLAMVKLLGGGLKGFSELSLVPSVQRGLMKLSHDVVHQFFVILMVPDHPLLRTTAWNFIGILFGPNLASLEVLFLLLIAPLIFIYYTLIRPIPEPDGRTGALRRKAKHLVLSDKRRKALPVIAFIVIILFTWMSQGGESVSRLYVPKPKPLVEDKGVVLIPVNDPTMDLYDGRLHKFSVRLNGKEIRLLVLAKPDRRLAVCLDACEICPPEGYGQRGGLVVCRYCSTPIPVETLGQAGGCNPIPLVAKVDKKFIRVETGEILKKWDYVNSGKGRENLR